MCAFVAYLFVWVSQKGEATATEIEPGRVLLSMCCVVVQFMLSAARHLVGCEAVAGVVASGQVLYLSVCSASLHSVVVCCFPQGDDVDVFGVEFVDEGANFG